MHDKFSRMTFVAVVSAAFLCVFACGDRGSEIATPISKSEETAAAIQPSKTIVSKEAINTVESMMIVIDGFLGYNAEHFQKVPEVKTHSELASVLAPGYISEIPAADGWGNPFKLVVESSRGTMLSSPGADKTFQLSDDQIKDLEEPTKGEDTNLGLDFVASTSNVVQYPALGTVAVEAAGSSPLKVFRTIVVRFGNRGQYVGVHGVVGNASTSPYPSVEAVPHLSCKENPSAPISSKKPEKMMPPEIRIDQLRPGMLRPFSVIVQLDLASMPTPCTVTATASFENTGGGPAIAHEDVGDTRLLTAPPAGMLAAGAKQGEIIARVNKVKRLILEGMSNGAGVSYDLKGHPLASDLTPVPYDATTKGLRDHFTTLMAKDDWSREDVDAAVSAASAQIAEYMKTMTPGPEGAEWSQFRHRNFETLKALAQKKLEKLNSED